MRYISNDELYLSIPAEITTEAEKLRWVLENEPDYLERVQQWRAQVNLENGYKLETW